MTALKYGETITIGSKGYTIGTTISDVRTEVTGKAKAGSVVTINGTEYKVASSKSEVDEAENILLATSIASMIQDGDKVVVGTQTMVAMTDAGKDGVGDNDASVISANKAYKLIANELRKASSIGTDAGKEAKVSTAKTTYTIGGTGTVTENWGTAKEYAKGNTQITFVIEEGKVTNTQGLQVGLHVGADADETNKITFTIDTMSAAGLGLKNLSVVDTTGAKATYAIDSIADAISKVSAQRSTLGAIQNRLEHTINNLDNVVENTTSAESQIRDTDMAEEMVEYSKNNILAQAGQSMLAQANSSNQGVLSLLG
jgi:flagellin